VKIIPAIDLMNGQVVRLTKGDPEKKTVYSDDPIAVAKKWENNGADMLHVVDLDATLSLGTNFQMIEKISEQVSIPIQVAGGLRDLDKILNGLKFSKRVVIGTIAMQLTKSEESDRISWLDDIDKSKLVISVDHISGEIVTHGWKQGTGIKLIDAMNEFVDYGFREFLMTNVSKDGTLEGPDIDNLIQVCKIDNVNVISSGGVSSLDDLKNIKKCDPYGVILGKALYENLISIEEAKKIS
jgi:phosphoribosylformimino-5-aminoimidazole carboxamide ribotide isomerase